MKTMDQLMRESAAYIQKSLEKQSVMKGAPLGSKDEAFKAYKLQFQKPKAKYSEWVKQLNDKGLGSFVYDNGDGQDSYSLKKETMPKPTPSPEDKSAELSQMYALAYVDSRLVRLFKQFAEYSIKESNSALAEGFSRAVAGLTKLYHYTVEVDGKTVDKLVFDTGVVSENGRAVYAVFQTNPFNTDGSKQPYSLQGFWCSDGDFGKEIYNELVVSVPQLIKAERRASDSFVENEEIYTKLKQCQVKFAESNEQLTAAIEAGEVLDDAWVKVITEYHAGWKKLAERLPECTSLSAVEEELKVSGNRETAFNESKDTLLDIILKVTAFCEESGGIFENSVKLMEKLKEDTEQVKKHTMTDCEALLALVDMYQGLLDVTLKIKVEENTEKQLKKHFDNNVMQMAIYEQYFEWFPEKEFRIEKESRETALKNVKESLTLLEASEEETMVSNIDADELLNIVMTPGNVGKLSDALVQTGAFCTTEFETALVEANYERCKTLLEDETVTAVYGNKESLLAAVCDLEDSDNSLVYSEIARRLSAVIGNRNQLAEKYYILGLTVPSTAAVCAKVLANLYAEEGDRENFSKVWEAYKDALEQSPVTLKMLLAEESEERVMAYLDAHGCMLHIPAYVEVLKELADANRFTALAEMLRSRQERLSDLKEPNAFEAWLLESKEVCRIEEIRTTIQEIGGQEGYTDEQIGNILTGLDLYQEEIQNSSPLMSLFWLEGNQNGVFERCAWEHLANAYDAEIGVRLLRLLDKEKRFEDVCDLKCYENVLVSNQEARRLYFKALARTSSSDFSRFARDNLQDCLTLLHVYQELKEEDVEAFAEMYSDIGDKASEAFCNSLLSFNQMLKDDQTGVLKNIITISATGLNSYSSDFNALKDFGLDEKACERFTAVYRTQTYAGGRDAVAVAQRVYVFVGACKGYAQCFAEEALAFYGESDAEQIKALVKLLWKIYSNPQNTEKKQSLLKTHRAWIDGNEAEICDLYFKAEMFEEFSEEAAAALDKGVALPNLPIQNILIDCKRGDAGEDLWNRLDDLNGVATWWVIRLAEVLAQKNPLSAAKFAAKHFEEVLNRSTDDEIRAIVTAGGTLPVDVYAKVRSKTGELTIYLYETFRFGSHKKKSEEYFTAFTDTFATLETEDKQMALRRMKRIYAANSLRMIQLIACQAEDAKDDANTVKQLLEETARNVQLDRDGLKTVIMLLCKYSFVNSIEFYERLIENCRQEAMMDECVELLHTVVASASGESLMPLVCELYDATIADGSFKNEWVDDAQRLCERLMHTASRNKALLCLYNIQKHLNNRHYQKYLLLLLCETQKDLDEMLSPALEADKNVLGIVDGETTRLSLFEEVANEVGVEELTAYCEFCGRFIDDTQSLEQEDELSEDEEKQAALLAVYIAPRSADVWKSFSETAWDEKPVIYTKLLYKMMMLEFSGKDVESCWMMCIKACRLYKQYGLLHNALMECSRRLRTFSDKKAFREFLEETSTKDAACFSEFSDEDKVALCEWLSDAIDVEAKQVMFLHNSLRDLSAVVVAMDSRQALTVFHDRFKDKLYSENSDLNCIALAMAIRLMQRERFEEAQAILQQLHACYHVKYKQLICKLANLDAHGLQEWTKKTGSVRLMSILLPDGNYPNIEMINAIVTDYSSPEKAQEGAGILQELIDNNRDDYGVHMALFMLSKQDPEQMMMPLHRALVGLVNMKAPITIYKRTQRQFAEKLALLNALIKKEGRQKETGGWYNFDSSTREYYAEAMLFSSGNSKDSSKDSSLVDKAETLVERILANESPESVIYRITKHLVLSVTTDNWCSLLEYCWKERDACEKVFHELAPSFRQYAEEGLTRSILRTAYAVTPEERRNFVNWVSGTLFNTEQKNVISKQVERARMLFINLNGWTPDDSVFNYPFEETSFNLKVHKALLKQTNTSDDTVFVNMYDLFVNLAHSWDQWDYFQSVARQMFEEFDNEHAFKLYSLLFNVMKAAGAVSPKEHVARETIEAMMRICGVFIDREDIVAKVRKEAFHSWSCINMVMSLLHTKRADELNGLKRYFSKDNQQLATTVLTVVNPYVSDDDKQRAIKAVNDLTARGLLCRIALGHPSGKTYLFLSSREGGESVQAILDEAMRLDSKMWNGNTKMPKHTLLYVGTIHRNAFKQKTEEEVSSSMLGRGDENLTEWTERDETDLSFIKALSVEAIVEQDSNESHEELLEKRQNHPYHNKVNRELCKNLSEQIYQQAVLEGVSKTMLKEYAILYGVDLYYCAVIDKKYVEARNILLETVDVCDPISSLYGHSLLKAAVNQELCNVFKNSYTSLYEMVTGYCEKQLPYKKMLEMIDKRHRSGIKVVYEVLEMLYKAIRPDTNEFQQEALREAGQQLRNRNVLDTEDLQSVVYRFVAEEIRKLNQKPHLKLVIYEEALVGLNGYVYGYVKNEGFEAAEDIQLSMEYSFGGVTKLERYEVWRLDKGCEAAFKLAYSGEASTLDILVQCTYKDHVGRQYVTDHERKTLLIRDAEERLSIFQEPFEVKNSIRNYQLITDGGKQTMYSEELYGREEEKAKLDSVFGGETFGDYKNMLVMGIRRVGKSSLLNYLQASVNARCNDAIAIFVSCESNVKYPIHHHFVKMVIQQLRGFVSSHESIEEFEQKWKMLAEEKQEDLKASDLGDFYQDVKQLTGKGTILIVDEFDNLLDLMKAKNIDNQVLSTLSSLLGDQWRDLIHIVICGSSKMTRRMNTYDQTQFFAKIGSDKLVVGKLNDIELKRMLKEGAAKEGMAFSDEALGWIWNSTGGLVWYTKLVANRALNEAYSHSRNIAYPSDVYRAIKEVASQGNNFANVIHSLDGDSQEENVLKALQYWTAKPIDCLSAAELAKRLKLEVGEVATCLSDLCQIGIVESETKGGKPVYRFAVQLYWHFFKYQNDKLGDSGIKEEPLQFELTNAMKELFGNTANYINNEEDDEDE